MSVLPASPSRRRLLVVITDADRQRWRMNRESRALLDDDQVAVVPWPYEEGSGDAVLDRLVADGLLRPAAVLIQDPFDRDSYHEPTDAAEAIARSKLMHLVRVCQLLGAASVEIEEVTREQSGRSQTMDLSDSTQAELIGSSADRQFRAFVSEVNVSHGFAPGPWSATRAHEYLRRRQLTGDGHLVHLVEMRAEENVVTEQSLELTTRTEIERVRGLLGRVQVPLAADLQGKVERTINAATYYRFRLSIRFHA